MSSGVTTTSAVGGLGGEHNSAESNDETDPHDGNESVADVGGQQAVSLTRATSNNTEDSEKELEKVGQETVGDDGLPG